MPSHDACRPAQDARANIPPNLETFFCRATMRTLEIIVLASVALLFVLWPIPHTISIRDLLLTVVIGLVSYLSYKNFRGRPSGSIRVLRIPIGIFCVLTAWVFVVAIFISDDVRWSLDEVRGQWLKPSVVAVAGGLLAFALKREPWKNGALLAIFAAVLLHVLYVDWIGLEGIYKTGIATGTGVGVAPMRVSGLTEGPDKSSYLANYLVVFLLAELIFRTTYHRRALFFNTTTLSLLALVAFGGVFFTSARNGLLEIIFGFVLATIVFLHLNRTHLRRPAVGAVAIILLLIPTMQGLLSFEADGRWRTIVETIPVALDTDKHKAWLDDKKYPLPRLQDGAAVDTSTYYRVAWIKEGAILALENPLGVGFGRNVFGHAKMQKYGEGGTGYSHSGFLDLAIGAGIPGAMLWAAFLISLAYFGYRGIVTSQSYYALFLFLLVGMFGFRMLIDSVMRDHMFQTFMFLVGWVATTLALELSTQDHRRVAPIAGPIDSGKAPSCS